MLSTFYNDNEPYVTEWLQNLILFDEISNGDVCATPIQDLDAWQLAGYTRCHFFAGLGGWDYALKLAGWPEDREVWTGSCPCQPFSIAGKRKGINDNRHLWPYFRDLIAQCRPATIFGEQVASSDGRQWLAGVLTDLEALGYAVAAADLCAAGVAAPHIRQRLYWVADSEHAERRAEREKDSDTYGGDGLGRSGDLSGVADSERAERWTSLVHRTDNFNEIKGRGESSSWVGECSTSNGSGNTDAARLQERRSNGGIPRTAGAGNTRSVVAGANFWSDYQLIPGLDGAARRIEPGVSPLAHGIPARVGKLRAYGNAIVPQVAAEFIKAFLNA